MEPNNPFEEKLLSGYKKPEPDPEFVNHLDAQLRQKEIENQKTKVGFRWAYVFAPLMALLILFFAVGPNKVIAQLQSWFGLLPGVGVVEPGTTIRELKESVSQTRDGITVEVSKAILTDEKSLIYFAASNIPTSAFSGDEGIPGCHTPYYLETEAGQRFEAYGDSEFETIPPTVDALNLIIPCLHGTLPGTTPENWQIALEFVPSEEPLELTPVYLFPTATPAQNETSIVLSHSLVEGDDLILAGYIRNLDEKYRNLVSGLDLFDANGQPVPFIHDASQNSLANLLSNHLGSWIVRLKPEGLAFPLEIRQSYLEVSQPLEDESGKFTITLPDEYPMEDILVQRTVEIAGESVELYFVRIQPSQFGGYEYDFYFKEHPIIKKMDVSTQGSSPSNSGTSFGAEIMHGEPVFRSAFWLEEGSLHGKLEIEVTNPVKVLETTTLTQSFTPSAELLNQLKSQSPNQTACIDYSHEVDDQNLQLEGKVLVYQETVPLEGYGLVIYNLDGSEPQIIGKHLVHSALSPDGQTAAFIKRDEGLKLFDLASGTERQISDIQGFDLHWSPDGQWIALQTYDGAALVKADGSQTLRPSEQGNGNIVGWSADSERLYFRKSSSSDTQGRLFVYSLETDQSQQSELLDSDRHISSAFSLSPDEKWAVYPKNQLDWVYEDLQTGEIIALSNGIRLGSPIWLNDGRILFTQYDQLTMEYLQPVLINPSTCQVIQLPDQLSGQVFDIWLDQ